ncbi:hypothetical protein DQT32_04440 [Salmonella enterica subsp. enterica serovar Braenderup]|nr:hypothetical protein [Salmonella enterica subsp. enterica serovar Braenderup]
MTKEDVRTLANKVLSYKHLGTDDAMERVLGKYNDSKLALFSAVYDEIQNIRYPHGRGEDATNCE